MIEFVSFFLGLFTGIHPVELAVSGSVAAVEVRLDGRQVGTLQGAPWALDVDFGDLAPHQLVVVAYDAGGGQLGVARQWINLIGPAPEEDLELTIDAAASPPTASLRWPAAGEQAGGTPDAVEMLFGGEPVTIGVNEKNHGPSRRAQSWLRIDVG